MDSLENVKRRTYTVILTVGAAGSVCAWLVNELAGTTSGFSRLAFVVVIACTSVSIPLLRLLPVRAVEEAIFLIIGSVLLGVLVYALYFEPDPALSDVSLFSLYLWFPFIYIFVFLAHERSGALARSAILHALSIVFSLPILFLPVGERTYIEAPSTLGLSYISGASIIAVLYFLTSMKDDLRRTELTAERMKRLAETDPLTGVLNRRGMELAVERQMQRAEHHGAPLSLIVFDLDDFKSLNDAYGHDAGDKALVSVAGLVEPHLRSGDSFARWGGEEFAILAPDTPLESAHRFADRLRSILEEHDSPAGWELSASFGVSAYRPADSGTAFAKRADVALYRAKELGKNRTEIST